MKNLIDITGAILIMGFIIWVIAKAKIVWRGHLGLKRAIGDGGKDKQVFPTGDKNHPFWRHKGWFLIGMIAVVCLIAGFIYYKRTQNELSCLEKINYRAGTIYRIDGEDNRNFKTQEEAMNYCLKVRRF